DSAGGNTWTKGGEYTNGQGGAAAGATVSVWYSVITNTIPSGGTITATLGSAVVAKAMTAWEFDIDAGNTISVVAGTLQTLAVDGTQPGSMTISGLTSGEYLFVRGIGRESGGSSAFTPTASYTALTQAESATNGIGGIRAGGEFRIVTATGETSNPGWDNRDMASVFFALRTEAP
ncbi:MAG: hypothetical protein HY432_03360, partial [Candidatus Liptonbacteria bacterium]|nr:hypothetical protein [Candidatus Liptonbacteria bacterium]